MIQIILNRSGSRTTQRGVITIFISMLLLVLITVLIVAAYSLSTTNLRAVGNAQVREEAIAAANKIIEQTIDSDFINAGAQLGQPVDVNGDGTDDFSVDLLAPTCVRATQASLTTSSSVTLPGLASAAAWNSVWELDATATETTTGVKVRVIQGVRVLLSNAEKTALCS